MAVITIVISESPIQVVRGIPKTVSLSTNIPATIFYTLDGTDPTTASDIYIEAITLPTDKSSVTLKAFATDGVDTSSTISQTYSNSTFSQARQPRDKITGLNTQSIAQQDLGPFGSYAPNLNIRYDNTGGITVDSPEIENIPDGYDGTATGTHSNGTDQKLTEYQFRYSETNDIGEIGNGIGTLPAQVTIHVPPPPPTQSQADQKLFNPKALVIIQDGRDAPFDPNISLLNRPFFSLENPETARDGSGYYTTALEGSVPTGSLLRQHYNPREQTITYYYFDSLSLRWIISIEPFKPKSADVFSLDQVVFPSSSNSSKNVYKWILFKRSALI